MKCSTEVKQFILLRVARQSVVGLGVLVLGLLVVHVDVNTDACDDDQCGKELNPIVINTAKEIAEDEDDGANDGRDNTGIKFHSAYSFFIGF